MARKAFKTGNFGKLLYWAALIGFLFSARITLQAAGHKLYITHPEYYQDGTGAVSIINIENNLRISTLFTMPFVDRAIYVKPRNQLFLFSSGQGQCEIYDPIMDARVGAFNTGGPVADVVFSLSGNRMYVANGSDSPDPENTVAVIDPDNGEIIFEIVVGRNPMALELSADGSLLYVADHQTGVVSVVELKNFQVLRSFYGGAAPTDLELSWDGRQLFSTSANIDDKGGAGAGIALIDLAREAVCELQSTAGEVRKILAYANDKAVCIEDQGAQSTLNFYNYLNAAEKVSLSRSNQISMPGKVLDFISGEIPNTLIVSDSRGAAYVYDLNTFQQKSVYSDLAHALPGGIALVPVDFEAQLAARDSLIGLDPETELARKAFFEKAYLYRSMGDKNSEIRMYTDLAEKYSGTETEVLSYLRLGDLCYNDLLYANSAEFYSRAFRAYTGLLEKSDPASALDQNQLLTAITRLGEFSADQKKDYLKDIVSRLETLTVSSPQLAELNFLLAYYLKKQGDTRISRRCLDEVERQMINIDDKIKFKRLRDRIDLLEGKGRVVLLADKVKRSPMIDGESAEWPDKHALFIDRRTDVLANEERWVDERDLSVEVRVGYDYDNLYILGLVNDDSIFAMNESRLDKFVLYLDPGRNAGSFLYRQKEPAPDLITIEIIPAGGAGGQFEYKYPNGIHPVFGGKRTATGYCFEVKIPFAYLPQLTSEAGQKFGFGFEAWDADSELVKDPPRIMGWVAPTESLNGDRDFRMLGIVGLN